MIRGFKDDLGPNVGGIVRVDHVVDGGGNQDVAGQFEHLLVGNAITLRAIGDGPIAVAIFHQPGNVQTAGVVDAAVDIADGDYLAAHLVQAVGGPGPDVAEPLDDDSVGFGIHSQILSGLFQYDGHSATGGGLPPH